MESKKKLPSSIEIGKELWGKYSKLKPAELAIRLKYVQLSIKKKFKSLENLETQKKILVIQGIIDRGHCYYEALISVNKIVKG